jgi:hypothetical protein
MYEVVVVSYSVELPTVRGTVTWVRLVMTATDHSNAMRSSIAWRNHV